ncbi:MAG: hypothetical protein JWO88_2194, partial [Frankiales bacterium]|nr:hypothetical protein [Frankiales bacterium]
MSASGYAAAPRAVTVLPSRAPRRLTRRDGLVPAILAVELMAGVAFGVAASSGTSETTTVPARLTLAPVALVLTAPVGPPVPPLVTVVPSAAAVPPRRVGPAVGPLLPGTVRAVVPLVAVPPVAAVPRVAAVTAAAAAVPAAPRRHAPRNPFAALVTAPAVPAASAVPAATAYNTLP